MIKIFFLNHSLVMLPKIITTNAQILKLSNCLTHVIVFVIFIP